MCANEIVNIYEAVVQLSHTELLLYNKRHEHCCCVVCCCRLHRLHRRRLRRHSINGLTHIAHSAIQQYTHSATVLCDDGCRQQNLSIIQSDQIYAHRHTHTQAHGAYLFLRTRELKTNRKKKKKKTQQTKNESLLADLDGVVIRESELIVFSVNSQKSTIAASTASAAAAA